jgi:hypothetical protein
MCEIPLGKAVSGVLTRSNFVHPDDYGVDDTRSGTNELPSGKLNS